METQSNFSLLGIHVFLHHKSKSKNENQFFNEAVHHGRELTDFGHIALSAVLPDGCTEGDDVLRTAHEVSATSIIFRPCLPLGLTLEFLSPLHVIPSRDLSLPHNRTAALCASLDLLTDIS